MSFFDFYNFYLLDIPYDVQIILASITDVLSFAIFGFIEMLFVRYLCGEKGKKDKRFWVFTSFLFVLNSLNGVILYNWFKMYIVSMFITYFLNIAIPLIYLFTSFKYVETIRKIIPPFLYQVLYISSYIISDLFYIYIFPADFIQTVFSTGIEKVVMICMTLIIHCIIMLLILLLYKRMMGSKGEFVILYFTVPLPFFLAIFVLLYPLVFDYEYIVYYFGRFYEIKEKFFIFGIIVALLSAICIYFLLFQMWQKNKLEKEKELYENMFHLEAKRYDDIKSSSEQIKKIRHDIKNMLYSVKAELEENNLATSKEKLDEILNSVNSVGSVIESQNRTVDYIVNAKLSNAGNRSIVVYGDVSGMERIRDVDISIILGNILDNAIEATNNIDDAAIKLSFFLKGNYQNILCENTVQRPVLKDNPKLITNKTEKSLHGFGVKSVKNVVSSYGGTVAFFEKDSKFCVHIMIPVK